MNMTFKDKCLNLIKKIKNFRLLDWLEIAARVTIVVLVVGFVVAIVVIPELIKMGQI